MAKAFSSTSVVNIDDGYGIESVEISYAIHTSATVPPGNPITDGGVPITDIDGRVLTDGDWQSTVPEVPPGYYLWTRTITYYTGGDFSIAYNVGYAGENGAQGQPGVGYTAQKEQWYLSTSPNELTGGSWSYNEPGEIPDGKYLWGRLEYTMSDGSTQHSEAVYRSMISGLISLADEVNKKITQKVWASDIQNSINSYDGTTGKSIRDRVTKTEQDISTINSTVSDVQSTLTQKADGTTVTNLEQRISTAEQNANGFRQTVEHNYAKLTDVGANNLYVIKNEVQGYIHSSNGTISNPSASKEVTSAYIPVDVGSTYIIQSWATPETAGKSWLAYQYYSDNQGTVVGSRVGKYGDTSGSGVEVDSNGREHLTYQITIPDGVTHIRVSYRHFDDGYAMVEKATTPSAYIMNPLDSQGYTDSAKSEIMQTANKITWLVQSGDSASNFTLTDHAVELISSEVVIKDPAGSSTIITGGKIQANAITTAMLATDAIKSTNYTASSNVDSPYSATGTFLDLSNGNFWTQNFGVINATPSGTNIPVGAWFNGTVYANAGRFGEGSSYWNIENFTDNNLNEYAGLVATGEHAYIQAGHWQVNDDAVQTKKYITTSEAAGQVSYYYDGDTTHRYYDVGMKIPIDFTERSTNDDKEAIYKKAFFYGRKSKGDFIPPSDSDGDWDYLFFVDHQGNIYEHGQKLSDLYAPKSGDAGGNYVMTSGNNTINGSLTVTTLTVTGTLTATASQANKLTNKLSINGVSFDGETDVTVGTIGVAYGGTGKTSWTANRIVYASATNTLNQLGAGTSGQILASNGSAAPNWINQNSIVAGSATNATNATNDANGDKIDTTYRKLSDTAFPNGLTGNVTGNVSGSAGSVKNSLIIKLNGGTTEGTDLFTYNGGAKKTINITGASLGLSEASTYGVDTSISSGSTSSNLPTTGAVVTFVEGQNYGVLGVAEGSSNGEISVTTASGTSSVAVHGLGSWAYKSSGSASDVGLGNVTDDKQVKGLPQGATTSGHLVVWGNNDGCTVADSGITTNSVSKTVTSLASNNDGKIVLTYLDGTTSDPIEVKIIGQSGSSVSYADALNVNGSAVGSASNPVFINAQGKPQQGNTIPTINLNNASTTSASFYAPIGAGTSGQYLKSNGTGAPTWATFSKSTVGLGNVDNTADANKNVLSATKFSDARSITLTGDTTGTASSDGTNGWSIPTMTKQFTTLGRLTSADIQTNTTQSKKVTFAYSSSAMTTSKPTGGHGYILTFAWDNGGYASQFFLKHTKTPHAMIRGAGSATINGVENSSDWGDWIYLLDANNYNSYSPTLEGTGATGTWDISIGGVAATATNAINDSDSNPINTTYAKLAGATFTGAVTGTTIAANAIYAGGNSLTSNGIALYGTNCQRYGLAIRSTVNRGVHGYVTGDKAEYFFMDDENSGWIYNNYSDNVASISELGNAVFNGSVTVGGNAENNSGCRLIYSEDTQSLDFVFN